jgi:hypothetical protein
LARPFLERLMAVREMQRIAILGTLDTKGDGVSFIKGLIEARGHLATVVDVGPLGPPLGFPGYLE